MFREKLEAFLLHSLESGLVSDGVLAQDIQQASSFWHIREVSISAYPLSFWFSSYFGRNKKRKRNLRYSSGSFP